MSEIDDAREQVIKQLTLQDSNDFDNPLPNNVAKTPVVITKNGDNISDMLFDKDRVDDTSIMINDWGKLAVKLSTGEGGLPQNIVPGYYGIYVQPASYAQGDLDLPDSATTTVTPEQFNKLALVVKNLIIALQGYSLLEKYGY